MKDDTLLEVIIVCGTFAVDEKCATMLVDAGLPNLLITVLKGNRNLCIGGITHSQLLNRYSNSVSSGNQTQILWCYEAEKKCEKNQ